MNQPTSNRRNGVALIYGIIVLTCLLAMASLAVDLGRVQLAKTELRQAADAAALYAAGGINDGTWLSRAISGAADNKADGTSIVVTAADVRTGNWDSNLTPQFSTTRSPTNAVEVTTRRTTSRGNAMSLWFGSLVGMRTCDVSAVAIAAADSGGYGVVGLNYINMGGNSSDSYWSNSGQLDPSHGGVASNGNITLKGNSSIHGDARPGVGMQVIGSGVSGSTAPLTSPLVYPNGDAGSFATNNDNNLMPNNLGSSTDLSMGKNQTSTAPGGNYYFRNFTLAAGANLTFTGPAVIYVYGTMNMGGHIVTNTSIPLNLKIVMVPNGSTPPGAVNFSSTSDFYGSVYAPQSPITMSGNGDLYGYLVGKSVDMTGTSGIHYDLALPNGSSVRLVK